MKSLREVLGGWLARVVNRYITPHVAGATTETLMDRAARFAACEMIEGDYLEFGVYRGDSFVTAYHTLQRHFRDRIAQSTGGAGEAEARRRRQVILDGMRYVAFDSFQGLPALSEEDAATPDFTAGQYAASEQEFRSTLAEHDVPADRVVVVPGWFKDTCTPETRRAHDLRKAAVVWIDADLYSSARTALDFVTPLLQDGTVVVFDDWFSYRGSPYEGEQRAFREWLEGLAPRWTAAEHARESWKRMSFIMSRVP